MKRLVLTFAVALLLAGVVLFGASAKNNGQDGRTEVYWSADGCWIDLDVHKGVDLGKITEPGQVLEDASGNGISLRTNCAKGYVLNVKALDASTPQGFQGDILADFQWKVVKVSGNAKDYQKTYTSFPGFGKERKAGTSDRPGAAHFHMAYKYTSDEQDIPGDYSITLEYTATSQ